jgi:hypothetical protein
MQCTSRSLRGRYKGEREGTRFPHTPHSGGVSQFFDFVEKTTNPTAKLWHADAYVFRHAQTVHNTGETC